uniref:adenosylcobinamide-GDP ribazoletransferase n=1 Tax=Methylibium sp. T29-B TaxID=1437443 RepID=UPI0028739D2F|nr:adenosylcobinamide-GDP ribazoletransferase [Methylibium sp. T29-B]
MGSHGLDLVARGVARRPGVAGVASALCRDAEHAKAKPLATRASGRGLGFALVWVGVASGAAVWVTVWTEASSWTAALWVALSALAACASATLCCARWLHHRLGGFTGDTLGATQQIVELVGLLTWLAWLPFTGGSRA